MGDAGVGTKCDSCGDTGCSAHTRDEHESQGEFEQRQRLHSALCRIDHKVVVMSGKGGVGKSTVAVNIATALMMSGKRVGLLDVDVHGPSVPTMLGLEGITPMSRSGSIIPVEYDGIRVMSVGFLLKDADSAVVWRGPLKAGVIRQFLSDVAWGDLDYLIVDSPPGTGDEPLSVCQLIEDVDGAVIVTTPQKVAAVDVRKSITFCQQLGVPVLGVLENMSGFACPHCGEITHILSAGGGETTAREMGVPFLGSLPIDPAIAEAGDAGRVFVHREPDSPVAQLMVQAVQRAIDAVEPGNR